VEKNPGEQFDHEQIGMYTRKDTTGIGPPTSNPLLPYTISLNQSKEQFQMMFLTLIQMCKTGL
jgi:hypothetical protein